MVLRGSLLNLFYCGDKFTAAQCTTVPMDLSTLKIERVKSAAKPLYFDVTEIIHGSSGRVNYGILRVVLEITDELIQQYPETNFVWACQKNAMLVSVPRQTLSDTIFDIREANEYGANRDHLQSKISRKLKETARRVSQNFVQHDHLQGEVSGVFVSGSRPKLMRRFLTEQSKNYPNLEIVPLLHDVLPLRHNTNENEAAFLDQFRKDTALAINSAKMLLSNSEHTLNEVEHFSELGLLPPLPRLKKAIPLAHELKVPLRDAGNEVSIPSDFVLSVGSSLGRKNIEVVMLAIEELAKRAKAPDLVIAGSKGSSIQSWMRKNVAETVWSKIRFINNPTDTPLLHLYGNARALVLSSKDEGWGLPAGEALWNGVPVIASNIPIMRELGGSRLSYFDPDNAHELSKCIDAVASKSMRSSRPVSPCPDREGLRCWSQVTQELVEAVQHALAVCQS